MTDSDVPFNCEGDCEPNGGTAWNEKEKIVLMISYVEARQDKGE